MKPIIIFFFVLFFASKVEAQNNTKTIPVEWVVIDRYHFKCPDCFVVVDTTTKLIVQEFYISRVLREINQIPSNKKKHVVCDVDYSMGIFRALVLEEIPNIYTFLYNTPLDKICFIQE